MEVQGTVIQPNNAGSIPVRMTMQVTPRLPPIRSVAGGTGQYVPASPNAPAGSEFARITWRVSNDDAVGFVVGLQLKDHPDEGIPGFGCGLLWDDSRPYGTIPDINLTPFARRCGLEAQSTNFGVPGCSTTIGFRPAHAPWGTTTSGRNATDTSEYTRRFGETCERITRGLAIGGTFQLTYLGRCELSSL